MQMRNSPYLDEILHEIWLDPMRVSVSEAVRVPATDRRNHCFGTWY